MDSIRLIFDVSTCFKFEVLKFEVLFTHKYIAVKKLNCVFTHIMKIVKLN